MIILTLLTLIVAISLWNANNSINPGVISRITSIFFIYSAILSFNVLYIESLGSGIGVYSGLFQITTITQSIDIFIFLIAAFILMPWSPKEIETKQNINNVGYINENKEALEISSSPVLPEYSLILLFTVLGGSLLISSSDLISMYLSIELQSFAVYLLATINRDSESSTSAGLKYFLLGGLSSCFILLGAGLIYSYTGLTNLESIYSLVPSLNLSSYQDFSIISSNSNVSMSGSIIGGFLLGIVLISVGFLFKIAASPFHNWAPDVYDEVPTIVTTWLTIMPKISIIIFLLELNSGLFSDSLSIGLIFTDTSINVLKNLFLLSSLLSLIIGTVVGLAQYKIKRLLAYSTISHVGFLLLALAVNTEQSIESLIFYILQYSITNLNTFLILLVFGYTINSYLDNSALTSKLNKNNLDIKYISELKGQFIHNPILSLSLATCLFSMAGIPPLLGFFAKQQVLYSATTSGYYFLSIVAILVSVISASYYLQIIKVIHFPSLNEPFNETISKKDPVLDVYTEKVAEVNIDDYTPIKFTDKVQVTNIHSMTISVLTLTIWMFIFNPSLILNSTHLLALSIFNF